MAKWEITPLRKIAREHNWCNFVIKGCINQLRNIIRSNIQEDYPRRAESLAKQLDILEEELLRHTRSTWLARRAKLSVKRESSTP